MFIKILDFEKFSRVVTNIFLVFKFLFRFWFLCYFWRFDMFVIWFVQCLPFWLVATTSLFHGRVLTGKKILGFCGRFNRDELTLCFSIYKDWNALAFSLLIFLFRNFRLYLVKGNCRKLCGDLQCLFDFTIGSSRNHWTLPFISIYIKSFLESDSGFESLFFRFIVYLK